MLQKIALPSGDTVQARAAAYHTVIIDRSGSMSGVIRRVVNDAADRIKYVAEGDRFRVMWYSTEGGEWGVGYDGVIRTDADRDLARDKTLALGSTVGLTCFSEVLTDWARSLQGWAGPSTLVLLTDGYPVVSNRNREKQNIAAALQIARKHNVSASAFVGYGYYDRQTLADMQELIGGTIVHADNLALFGDAMGSMIGGSSNTQEIDASHIVAQVSDPVVFTFRDGLPVSLPVSEAGTVQTTGDVFISHPELRQDRSDLLGLYGAAVLWNQRGRGDIAADCIALTQDKGLFDRLSNAMTPFDHSAAETDILDAIKTPSSRFVHGKRANLQVDPHAFSLFGLLDILQSNQDVKFVPSLPGWKYNRIGAASERNPDVVTTFDAERAEVDFGDLVFDSERINLSVRVQYNGKVIIPGDVAAAKGLPPSLKSKQYRNYTLMRDGKLNVTHLPLRLPVDLLHQLHGKGLQVQIVESDGLSVLALVDISTLPVMNRTEAAAGGKFEDVAMLLLQEAALQAYQKLLNAFTKVEREAEKAAAYVEIFGQEAAEWLKGQGVSTSGYNPPSKQVKSGDSYPVTLVKFSLKGLSSIDTAYGKILQQRAQIHFDEATANLPDNAKMLFAVTQLRRVRKDLTAIRRNLTAAKFGIVFSKRWFSDLPSREVTTIEATAKDEHGATLFTTEASVKITEKEISI